MNETMVKLFEELKAGHTLFLNSELFSGFDDKGVITLKDESDHSFQVTIQCKSHKGREGDSCVWCNEGDIDIEKTVEENGLCLDFEESLDEDVSSIVEEMKEIKKQLEELQQHYNEAVEELGSLKENIINNTISNVETDKYAIYRAKSFYFQGSVWEIQKYGEVIKCMICQTNPKEYKLICIETNDGGAGNRYYDEVFTPDEEFDNDFFNSREHQFSKFRECIEWLEEKGWKYIGQKQ